MNTITKEDNGYKANVIVDGYTMAIQADTLSDVKEKSEVVEVWLRSALLDARPLLEALEKSYIYDMLYGMTQESLPDISAISEDNLMELIK